MVKENTVTGVHAVGFAVVNRDPVGVQFGDVPHMESAGRTASFFLRNFLHQTVQFRGGSLIETGFLSRPRKRIASSRRSVPIASTSAVYSGDWNPQRGSLRPGCTLHPAALHAKCASGGGITQVAIMQMEFRVAGVRILINVIHALGVE